jgi:molybdopterin converting factor small subunit
MTTTTKPRVNFMEEETVKIVSGVNEQEFPIAGKTIGEIRESLREVFNIDDNAQAIVNGQKKNNNYALQSKDVVEFIHPIGEKG